MKALSKLLFATTCLFCTAPLSSQAMQFMLDNSASEQQNPAIGLRLVKQVMTSEESPPFPMFPEKFSASTSFLTKDGKVLELSFYYDPKEENNGFMPKLSVMEGEYGSVGTHFYQEFVLQQFSDYPFEETEAEKNLNQKINFLKTSQNNKWLESLLQNEEFNPTKLFEEQQKIEKNKNDLKEKLEKFIHNQSFEEFSIKYATTANLGFFKKYHGSELGPIQFNPNSEMFFKSKKKQKMENSEKEVYNKNTNYGVFQIQLSKKEGKPQARFPNDVNSFSNSIDTFITTTIDEKELYAVTSYGHQKNNDNMYM
jgi:hypothetical protein